MREGQPSVFGKSSSFTFFTHLDRLFGCSLPGHTFPEPSFRSAADEPAGHGKATPPFKTMGAWVLLSDVNLSGLRSGVSASRSKTASEASRSDCEGSVPTTAAGLSGGTLTRDRADGYGPQRHTERTWSAPGLGRSGLLRRKYGDGCTAAGMPSGVAVIPLRDAVVWCTGPSLRSTRRNNFQIPPGLP